METMPTDKILQLMRLRGPVLPVHAAKAIESNIMMASAHLSDLASRKQVLISSIKVGSSPLYYLPGQEARLQEFTNNLHEKEKKAYDLIRQKRILKDSDLDPVFRVAMRQIKDFAVPLEVIHNENKEIFWKWYLTSNQDAESLIKEMIIPQETKIEEKKEAIQEEKIPETKPKEIQKEIFKEEKPKEQKLPKKEPDDLFFTKINNYFNRNKIRIIEKEVVKKGSEIDFIISIPSSIGELAYFCKARAKKRINDNDLSNAFVKGQLKKLPVLFLTDGELTTKAKEILERDFKMHFKQI